MNITKLKKQLSALGFGLFFLAVLGAGIGYRENCHGGFVVETNLTFLALYSLTGLSLCER